jgi:hypothetical protein
MARIGLVTDRKRSKCAPSAPPNALPALPGDHRKKWSRSLTDGVIPLTDFSAMMHFSIYVGSAAIGAWHPKRPQGANVQMGGTNVAHQKLCGEGRLAGHPPRTDLATRLFVFAPLLRAPGAGRSGHLRSNVVTRLNLLRCGACHH